MKAQLTFNLPDEQNDFDMATQGHKWYLVAWEMDQHLRSELKYNIELTPEEFNYAEKLRERFREIIYDHSLSFD